MKYYSEITKKLYDTDKALKEAELEAAKEQEAKEKALEEQKNKLKALTEKRSERAKEVENAFKVANEAQKQANDLLNKFVDDYGSYHYSIHETKPFSMFSNLLDLLF